MKRPAQPPAECRLSLDAELGVLWLARGPQELALSDGGLWLHSGRHEVELTWDEVDQVQLSPARGDEARVEVFVADGAVSVVGPFPLAEGEHWVRAAATRAAAAGLRALPLDGAVGFAVRS